MNLEAETAMFLAAGGGVGCVAWCDIYRDELIAGEPVTVYSPKGSKFKNRACVVEFWDIHTNTARLLREYNPTRETVHHGKRTMVFKEGQHVLAGTGAFAALRREAESAMLRDRG